jgi:hypothetical protein
MLTDIDGGDRNVFTVKLFCTGLELTGVLAESVTIALNRKVFPFVGLFVWKDIVLTPSVLIVLT